MKVEACLQVRDAIKNAPRWQLKPGASSGLGCTTTSRTDPPPRWHHLSDANWRPWHFNIITVTIPKRWVATAEVVTSVTQSGTAVHLG